MQLLITGTPGTRFEHVCDLLATGTDWLPSAITQRHSDPAKAWIACPDGSTTQSLIITNYPGDSFLDAVVSGKLPSVIVLDSPLHSFLDLRRAGHDAIGIIRNLSACATRLGELSRCPAALLLGPEVPATPAAVLQAISNQTGWPLPSNGAGAPDGSEQTRPSAAILSPQEHSLVTDVLEPAFHFAATGDRSGLTWPHACLLSGDNPGQPAPAILDLTGPARVLVYGPYLHIPPGHWTAQAKFAFSPSSRGTKLALEFHGISQLARCSFTVEQPGVFQIDLPVHIPSAREAIELRLVLEHGAIEGHLGLDGIQLLPTHR